MQCLNIKNPEVAKLLQEYTDILGSYNAAYYVISENNGYGLDKTPNGEPSKLFSDLLKHYNGDRVLAIQAKAKVYSESFKEWFGDWVNPLKPGDIVFGHPGIGKTYSLEHGKYKDKIIDWDVEFNEKRDKWIEQHSNTTKGTPEYKKARNEYLIYPENHPDYVEFVTSEWNRVKSKAKKEGKVLFASPHNLLKMFPQDFNRIINLEDDDFVKRNTERGGKERESKLWKEGINNTISNTANIPIEYLNKGQHFEDYLDRYLGISKVVDANGEPLVVYHTVNPNRDASFEVFDTFAEGKETMIYHTDDKEMSLTYGKNHKNFKTIEGVKQRLSQIPKEIENAKKYRNSVNEYNEEYVVNELGYDSLNDPSWLQHVEYVHNSVDETIKSLISEQTELESILKNPRKIEYVKLDYVSLRNPLIVDGKNQNWNELSVNDKDDVLAKIAYNDSYDSFKINTKRRIRGEIIERSSNKRKELFSLLDFEEVATPDEIYELDSKVKKELETEFPNGLFELESTRSIEELYRKSKYDGIIFKNIKDYGGGTSWLQKTDPHDVFAAKKSNQIKSIDNRGTFSTQDNNIYANETSNTLLRTDPTLFERLFENKPEVTAFEMLDNLDMTNPAIRHMAKVLSALPKSVLKNVKIYYKDKHGEGDNPSSAAEYDPNTHNITVWGDSSFKGKGALADISILHELVHAATITALMFNPSMAKEAERLLEYARKKLAEKYNKTWEELYEENKNTFYGLKNAEEFLAEFFANSSFIKELLQIEASKPLNGQKISVFKEFVNWVSQLLHKLIGGKQTLWHETSELLEKIMFVGNETFEGMDMDYFNYIQESQRFSDAARTSDAKDIKQILTQSAKNISFEPTSHTYTNTLTGEIYTPVSTVKDTMGFGADTSVMSDETLAYGEMAAKVGSAIHDFIHSELTGEKMADSEITLSKEAKSMIRKSVIPKFFGKGDELIASEQMIANDSAKVAGTVDLIIKDEDGNIHLLDFKTKARTYKGKGKYGFDYYYSSKKETKEGGKPDSERHDFQLTMYKRMLELQGVQVDSKGIIPLEYTFNEDGVITEVWMPELDYTNKRGVIHHRTNNQLEQELDKAVFSGDPNITTSEIDSENLIKQSEIVQNILKVLKNQLALYRVKGYTTKAEVLSKVINNLNKLEEGEVIVSYINQAIELLKPLIDEYNANLAAEKAGNTNVWSLSKLEAWKNYAESFTNLEDIQDYLFTNSDALSYLDKDTKEALIETLATAISYKNALENSYKAKGERIWLNWLTPFTTKVEAEYRRDAEKAYKKANKGSEKLSDKASMEKYINDYLEEHRREIELKSRELLRQQSKIATTSPLGAMSRWMDSVFESADPIVGSMAKAYHTTWMESIQTFNEKYRKLIDLLEELERAYPSMKSNPKKFYDFMIENDEHGIRLISSMSPAFQDAYEKAKKEINANPKYETNADKASAIAAWLNENAPIVGKKVLENEKIQYLQYLLDKGEITAKQHKALLNNEKRDPSIKRSWADLTYRGVINEKVADMLRVKFNELNWAHRKPDAAKYKNEKWEALEKLRESNPQDVRVRFFDFISTLSNEGDTYVPDRFKLNGRLPGMSKVLAERVVSGNMTKQLWEGVKKEFEVRADDTNRGMQMTDELDRPVKFIPIFFTNTLPESEQSFDIATIYKEWFRSVNNYKYINEILPQLEYTKWVIENRKTTKTDSKGNPVKNVLSRIIRNGENDMDPTTNALVTDENLIAQINAWFDQVVYGISDNDLGTFMGIDGAKALNLFQKYTSLKVMGVNMVSMVNNALMAEVQQMEEAFAGQYVSKESYTRASGAYLSDLPNIMGDLGSRKITSLTNLLNEHFGVFVDYNEGSLLENNRAKKLGKLSTLYFTTNIGEHEAQSRFLQACLMEKRALDKNGNDIGSVYDFFTVENGRLVFDKNKQVANFGSKEQLAFGQQVSAILRKMHGNYAPYSKVALQQNGMGKMVLMFRKWIYTTAKRRWSKEYYDEFGQTFSKGFYRDGGSFYYNKVRSFFERFRDEAKALEIAEKADWSTMTEAEKANVKRFTTEIGVFAALTIMSTLLGQIDTDDDDEVTNYVLSNLDYQLFRLSTDLTFYISPASFLRIVQSPLPSSSVIKQVSNLFDSLLDPTAKFKTGDWKGEYKIKKRVMDLLPIVRQIYRLRNIEDEKQLLSIL